MEKSDYININRESWNKRTAVHFDSEFYDNESFIQGRTSLNSIELELLGDIKGKKILHLQCHFGQDTISLSRMGASVTGVDLSDKSIEKAKELAQVAGSKATFICCDLYSLPNYLNEEFDIVFTSYGTIGWLPDINKWAEIVSKYLKPGGKFIFVEFHPVVWMFDDDFKKLSYNYSNSDPIIEKTVGTYTDGGDTLKEDYVTWNHGLAEVLSSLIKRNLRLDSIQEFDYSPYNCFKNTVEVAPNKFRIKHLGSSIPMVYALTATKK